MAKVPRYRKHSTRDLGFVQVDKKRVYFPGRFNSAESLSAYAEFVKTLAQKKDTADTKALDIRSTRGDDVPIRLLAAQFLDWAKSKFVKNGRSTGTYERFRDMIMPPLLEKFGDLPTAKFGPVDLKEIRKGFVKKGLCRNEVNDRTSRVKRIFSWGVGEELVPESVAGALRYRCCRIELKQRFGRIAETVISQRISTVFDVSSFGLIEKYLSQQSRC